MRSRRFLPLFFLTILLALATSPLLAQDSLTQNAHLTDSSGLTLTVSYPDGWVANVTSQGIMLASSADTLNELQQTGNILAGEVGMSISGPSELDRAHVSRTLSAEDTLKAYIEGNNAKGTIETSTDFSVPAAVSHLGISQDANVLALVGALTFPDGPALFAVLPDTAVDAEVMSILQSITLEAPPDLLAITPDTSVSLTTTRFSVPDRLAPLTLSLGLPDGWVSSYSDQGGLLYIGNSDAALKKASVPDVSFETGEIALTIALPHAVVGLGIHADASPEDAIGEFQTRTQSQGRAFSDDSFSVPAAHAHLVGGNLPEDGGDVFMLKFDQGLVFAVVQPSGIIDGTTMAILQSLQLADQSAPQATVTPVTTAKALRQWAVSANGTSQYGTEDWSFMQATGKPNTPDCGDNRTAWASESSTGRAVLQFSFAQPVIVSQINVYQSYNPGAIVEIDVGNSSNPDKVLPLPNSADPVGNTECPGVFSLDVSGVDTPIDFIVLYIDQSLTGDWNEIDAVELVGTPAS